MTTPNDQPTEDLALTRRLLDLDESLDATFTAELENPQRAEDFLTDLHRRTAHGFDSSDSSRELRASIEKTLAAGALIEADLPKFAPRLAFEAPPERLTDVGWGHLAEALVQYGAAVMDAWMRTGQFFVESVRYFSEYGFELPETPRDWIGEGRADLSALVASRALATFKRQVQTGGGWSASSGANVSTYFIGTCVYEFLDLYIRWLAKHAAALAQGRAEQSARGAAGAWRAGDLPVELPGQLVAATDVAVSPEKAGMRPIDDEAAVRGRVQVAIVESHPLYRVAVERVLAEADFVELGQVVDSVTRLHVHRQPPGRVVLLDLDLDLPGVASSAAVLEVCELGHNVLAMSVRTEPDIVLGAIAAGARGFLSKDVDAEELLIAIKTVADGGAYVSTVVAGMIIKDNADRPVTAAEIELSPREEQVLRLVAAGERDVDVALSLGIGVRTVRGYLDRIRDKTGEKRRPGLAKTAIQRRPLRDAGARRGNRA